MSHSSPIWSPRCYHSECFLGCNRKLHKVTFSNQYFRLKNSPFNLDRNLSDNLITKLRKCLCLQKITRYLVGFWILSVVFGMNQLIHWVLGSKNQFSDVATKILIVWIKRDWCRIYDKLYTYQTSYEW